MTANDDRTSKNALEWTVFALSCLLVVGTAALLGMAALGVGDRPAHVRAVTGKAEWQDGWLVVPVAVTNDGGDAATAVEIRVAAVAGGEPMEGGFTLDFLPRDATRRGSVSFRTATADAAVSCRVVGYGEP